VTDDGRGIPVDMMTLSSGEQMPAVQVVLTILHAAASSTPPHIRFPAAFTESASAASTRSPGIQR